jgi:hypothetical protein
VFDGDEELGEVTEDFDTAVRSILGQLLEARDDQNDADKRLQAYRAANTPPEVPNEFEDLDAFLGYHHRRQSYENGLKQHEKALNKAKKEYGDAADQLLLFLPDGVPYVMPMMASGARCLVQSTLSCASGVKSSSRVPAPPPVSCGEPERGRWPCGGRVYLGDSRPLRAPQEPFPGFRGSPLLQTQIRRRQDPPFFRRKATSGN